jgi:hypothetical protein
MPELRANNDPATHNGERTPGGRRQRISVPFLQTRLPNTGSPANERASREVNQLLELGAGHGRSNLRCLLFPESRDFLRVHCMRGLKPNSADGGGEFDHRRSRPYRTGL